MLKDTILETIKIGEVLEGAVTGIVPFGIFVNAGGVEGLVHISEISWDRVASVDTLYSVGQKVKVKVTQIDGNRVSFSIKRLEPDPWIKAYEEFKPGTVVKGEVTRITNFGAFVKISDHVAGLCHISQLGENIQEPGRVVRVGEKYDFKIINIEPATHRCSLQLVQEEELGKSPTPKPKSESKSKKEEKNKTASPKKTDQKIPKAKDKKKK